MYGLPMKLFAWRGRAFDTNAELGRVIAGLKNSGVAERATMFHLASIVRTIGPSGERLQGRWPAEQKAIVHNLCNEFVQNWLGFSHDFSEIKSGALSNDLKSIVEEISNKLALSDVEHPYEAPILASVEELLLRKSHRLAAKVILEVVETGMTFIVSLRWFPAYIAENSAKLNDQLSFKNVGSLQIYREVISRVINEDEEPLNAGASYMLNQGASGDGVLIATNKRLIFAFDEDYQKQPQSFSLQTIGSYSFVETSVVPMSKEMIIEVSSRELVNSVSFYVGDFFSTELAHLFHTTGIKSAQEN